MTLQVNESMIRNVVAQVLAEVGPAPAVSSSQTGNHFGVFDCPTEAIAAARKAFEQLSERTIDDRKKIIEHIRRISIEQAVELGTMEM